MWAFNRETKRDIPFDVLAFTAADALVQVWTSLKAFTFYDADAHACVPTYNEPHRIVAIAGTPDLGS